MGANMGHIRSMNRATKTIILDPDKGDFRQAICTGWHLDMDEDADWEITGGPTGHDLMLWKCKPHIFGNWKGEWHIRPGEAFRYRPDNEGQFFVLLVNRHEFNAVQGVSDAEVTNDRNQVNMYWHGVPGIGEVTFSVIARPHH